MTFYAALIWLGSIHLGWHYAIDGLASFGLALLIWPAMGRVADWLDRPAARPRAAPADRLTVPRRAIFLLMFGRIGSSQARPGP